MLHHYKGDSHCTKSSSYNTCMLTHTTTCNLSVATCVSLKTMGTTLSSIFRTQTHTHTGCTSTCISCASDACLCHHIGSLLLSPHAAFHKGPTVDNNIRLSSQCSIRYIDNQLLLSLANLSQSVKPQQKHHRLHVNKSSHVWHSPPLPPSFLLGDLTHWDEWYREDGGGE